MNDQFRKALPSEIPDIWLILQEAIQRRKEDGSTQWQNGYPNPEVLQKDIEKHAGYVLLDGDSILGYCAVLINDEPLYENIVGQWLSNGDYVILHRIAISDNYLGKGWAKKLLKCVEEVVRSKNIDSIKADTTVDNSAMISLFKTMGYTFCGEVHFKTGSRIAYEKILR